MTRTLTLSTIALLLGTAAHAGPSEDREALVAELASAEASGSGFAVGWGDTSLWGSDDRDDDDDGYGDDDDGDDGGDADGDDRGYGDSDGGDGDGDGGDD